MQPNKQQQQKKHSQIYNPEILENLISKNHKQINNQGILFQKSRRNKKTQQFLKALNQQQKTENILLEKNLPA